MRERVVGGLMVVGCLLVLASVFWVGFAHGRYAFCQTLLLRLGAALHAEICS